MFRSWLRQSKSVKDLRGKLKNPLGYVLKRHALGARLQVYSDVFGNHGVVLSNGWLIKRRVRVSLSFAQACALQSKLRERADRESRVRRRPIVGHSMASV
jgi:hypothetical protein